MSLGKAAGGHWACHNTVQVDDLVLPTTEKPFPSLSLKFLIHQAELILNASGINWALGELGDELGDRVSIYCMGQWRANGVVDLAKKHRYPRQREGKGEGMKMALNSKAGCRRNVCMPGKWPCVYSEGMASGAEVNSQWLDGRPAGSRILEPGSAQERNMTRLKHVPAVSIAPTCPVTRLTIWYRELCDHEESELNLHTMQSAGYTLGRDKGKSHQPLLPHTASHWSRVHCLPPSLLTPALLHTPAEW